MKEWYQWNIYYYGDMNRFISKYVKDIIERSMELEKKIEWFFIRYWAGGPHIRLRIKCTSENFSCIDKIIYKEMENVEDIFISKSDKEQIVRQQSILAKRENIEENFNVQDNKSIIRVSYEPEYEKYGRGEILKISEEIFGLSSILCLKLVEKNTFTEKKYVYSIWGFLTYIKLSNTFTAIELFEQYAIIWSEYMKISVEKFEENLKTKIDKEVAGIISFLNEHEKIKKNGEIGKWEKDTLDKLYIQKKLVGNSQYYKEKFLVILFNYIHVHNNRLGIKPVEEIYISLLLKEAYKILEGKSI